ncbi:MAG: AbrB family transcriptional regulator [Phenylobacterium sp.]|nr:MAG: AbrB family transcriptional regulator [Phenylobacterium sp.]
MQPLPAAARWAVLVAASVLAAALLQWARLPAALMLGPLAAAVVVQTAGGAVKVPRAVMAAAQAIIGCLVARSFTPAIVGGFASHWPVFLAVVAISIAASAGIGWTMSRLRVISGTTAVWGILPGGATAMMVLAEAYGADARLVAFMQYLRVVLVAAAASVVALLFVHGGGGPRFAGGYFPPIHWLDFSATLGVAAVGGGLGLASRIPAGVLLAPLALGAALSLAGLVKIELPPAALIACYAAIGWNTGLRFTRDVLAAAARALPQTLGATALLMAFCGLLAWVLVVLLHVDPLTAYLATSPGGVDAAVIIAASTKVDTSFVMALQMLRVIVVLTIGPSVARWVAGTLTSAAPQPEPPEPLDLGDLD